MTSFLTGCRIMTPSGVVDGQALELTGGMIGALVNAGAADGDCLDLGGGWLLPGFIDVQVNGGGDVLLNDSPTPQTMRTIAQAHRRFGTTGLLPTLISDDLAVVAQAMDAVDSAITQGVPGVLGLHIEGPFLNVAKKGIHAAGRIRQIDEDALALLTRPGRGVRLVTLAPELAPPGAIGRLVAAGVIVAGGHSMADYDQSRAALDAGLHGFTHLFNAMTQMESRHPGMVGAALEDRGSHFGLIVDGHHVHPASLRAAVHARGVEGVMLVTDAMPPVGGTVDHFDIMGTPVRVIDGTCRGPDGTLGGSMLTMAQAVRNAVDLIGVSLEDAARMASANPATFIRATDKRGVISPGLTADLVHLDDDLRVTRTWIAGEMFDGGG